MSWIKFGWVLVINLGKMFIFVLFISIWYCVLILVLWSVFNCDKVVFLMNFNWGVYIKLGM